MEQINTLIDKAAKVCGSRYALCKRLGIQQSNLSAMVAGKRGVPPALAARLAEVARLDPREAALVAVIEGSKDEREREELKVLFFRSSAAATLAFSVAVLCFAPSPSTEMARAGENAYQVDKQCILCKVVLLLLRNVFLAQTTIGRVLRTGLYGFATKPRVQVLALRVTIPLASIVRTLFRFDPAMLRSLAPVASLCVTPIRDRMAWTASNPGRCR